MGAAALPIALAVGSAAVGGINSARTANKQDKIAAEGIRRQGETRRRASAKLNAELAKLSTSGPERDKENLSANFLDQIRKKSATGLSGLDVSGIGASDAAVALSKQAGETATQYADRIQGLFSRIDAPQYQRQRERFGLADLGSEFRKLSRNSQQDAFLTQLKASRVRPSFLLSLLQGGLSGAAGATAGGLGAGVTASPFASGLPATTGIPVGAVPPLNPLGPGSVVSRIV